MGKKTLFARLLIRVLPPTLLAMAAVAAATYLAARGLILGQLEEKTLTTAQLASAYAADFFRQRRNDLVTIAGSPLFKDHYMNVDYGLRQEAAAVRREIGRMLSMFSRRSGVYPDILYLDASDGLVCRVRGGQESAAPPGGREKKFFVLISRRRPGEVLVSALSRAAGSPQASVEYGIGLYDDAGAFRGALIFSCSLKSVYAALDHINIGLSTSGYLVPRKKASWAFPRSFRDFVTAYAPVSGTPWAVLTLTRQKDLLAGLDFIGLVTLCLIVLAGLLIAIVVTEQVRILLGPVKALAEAAQAYSRGDLGARVAPAGSEETVRMGRSFNAMAERLKSRTEDLIRRVRELTALHYMHGAALRCPDRRASSRACLEAFVKGLRCGRGAFFWVDGKSADLVGECACGLDQAGLGEEDLRRERLSPIGNGVLARAMRERRMACQDASALEEPCDLELRRRLKFDFLCAVPVLYGGRTLAVVCLDLNPSVPGFAAKALSFSAVSEGAGLLLEKARLFEEKSYSEIRHRTTVENSPTALISLDQHFRITLWNRRAEALFGYPPSQARGHELSLILDEKNCRDFQRRLETDGIIEQTEARGRDKKGRALDLSLGGVGQDAAFSKAREYFVAIQDQSETKRLQRQLLESEKMSAIGRLIAGVAHELNNPLAAVVGFSELLGETAFKPEDREDLRHLRDSALRCRDIVGGLLSFVRKTDSERRRVSLNAVVRATEALFSYRFVKAESIRIETELDPSNPQVAAEFQKIQQVLANLLGNACDALKGRDGLRLVRLRTFARPEGPAVEVEDNGPGIPAEKRSLIFEPFYTTKPAGQGTGLGLSISSQIVSAFGGTLRCEEGREGGARFTASFPPCPAELPELASPQELPPPMPGRRVLVVDDEPDMLRVLSRLLKEDGLVPASTDRPVEALQSARSGRFDLIVSDVAMGDFNGALLLEAVKNLSDPPLFIFITGDVLNQDIARRLGPAVFKVLGKPFMREEFLLAVRQALRRKASRAAEPS